MYHKNAMTINKYVEAEQRTSPAARYKEGCFLLDPSDIKMESWRKSEDIAPSGDGSGAMPPRR